MHELPIVKGILEAVIEYATENHAAKVSKVVLTVGSLHDLIPEWVQKYFRFASSGTIAEEAIIVINKTPIICRCKACECNFVFHLSAQPEQQHCPECGSKDFVLVSGRELIIQKIEICKEDVD